MKYKIVQITRDKYNKSKQRVRTMMTYPSKASAMKHLAFNEKYLLHSGKFAIRRVG